jgi:hypothetical protein
MKNIIKRLSTLVLNSKLVLLMSMIRAICDVQFCK